MRGRGRSRGEPWPHVGGVSVAPAGSIRDVPAALTGHVRSTHIHEPGDPVMDDDAVAHPTRAEMAMGQPIPGGKIDADVLRATAVGEAMSAIDYEIEMLDTVLGSLFDRLRPYRSEREEALSGEAANPRDRHGEHVERLYQQAARLNSIAGAVRRVVHDLDL